MNSNHNQARHRRRRPRRGYTLIEVAISLFVLMTAMMITARVLGWLGSDRRASDRRQWAVQTVSNVLERVSAEPFDRVTAETVKTIAEKTEAARALPDPAWEVNVDDDRDAPVTARRVSVQLRWKERSGGWGAPVRLTSWVYRRGAAK